MKYKITHAFYPYIMQDKSGLEAAEHVLIAKGKLFTPHKIEDCYFIISEIVGGFKWEYWKISSGQILVNYGIARDHECCINDEVRDAKTKKELLIALSSCMLHRLIDMII